MGLANVYGLKSGTSGWMLAGYQLETGGNRLELPEPSPEGLAAAEAYADRLAVEDGVRAMDIPTLQARLVRQHQDACYFVDVRTSEEYEQGHIGDSRQPAQPLLVARRLPPSGGIDKAGPVDVHLLAPSHADHHHADRVVNQGGDDEFFRESAAFGGFQRIGDSQELS
jgi:rhodanese-related sulfurtransferase